jgi:hypothetical protein
VAVPPVVGSRRLEIVDGAPDVLDVLLCLFAQPVRRSRGPTGSFDRLLLVLALNLCNALGQLRDVLIPFPLELSRPIRLRLHISR